MNHRILDFSETPARLSVRHRNLVVEPRDQPAVSMPLGDVAVMVVSHPQVHYTHAVLSGLAETGGVFVTCDGNRLPIGMLLPIAGHHVQVERFAAQACASLPLKKRLWKQVVQAKIKAQSLVLERLHGDDGGLAQLVAQVRSGDTANVEARAARRYWSLLFADREFRRNRDLPDENRLLNYGYAVLRAIVARAICAAGLHPSLGIHHHNRYSTYCLADDLMEPLRPIVDEAVAGMLAGDDSPPALDRDTKVGLIETLMARYEFAGEQRTLFNVSQRMAASLAGCYQGELRTIEIPQI